MFGKMSCAALAVRTPHAIYPDDDKGARRSASMGQPIDNPRRQDAPQTLHTMRGTHIGSGTVAVIASTPTMPTAS
jgi:hypothetical protein